jgi:hypothetical protein
MFPVQENQQMLKGVKYVYMFRELLAHPQGALHKLHLEYCVRVMSVGCTRIGVELVCVMSVGCTGIGVELVCVMSVGCTRIGVERQLKFYSNPGAAS